jgi:hypothetical protein
LVAAWNWGIEYMNPNLLKPNPCQVKKGRVIMFKPREFPEGQNPSEREKAVSEAVNF